MICCRANLHPHVRKIGEAMAQIPSHRVGRSDVHKVIRNVVSILIESLRILAAEVAFTAAAVYGVYQAFRVLTR